jgi:hypothetical protein
MRKMILNGDFAFQDYAIAKWFNHVNAWVGSGGKFLEEAIDQQSQLQSISEAMDDFMIRYDGEDWTTDLIKDCKTNCSVFEQHPFYDGLVQLTSHIYVFQKKGFEARHKISIKSLAEALDRNRKLLEEFPKTKPSPDEKAEYNRFYDEERRFKCTRITCRYFSEGFKDEKTRKRHVNIHDRPFQCEVPDCLGADMGFANTRDLEKASLSCTNCM